MNVGEWQSDNNVMKKITTLAETVVGMVGQIGMWLCLPLVFFYLTIFMPHHQKIPIPPILS